MLSRLRQSTSSRPESLQEYDDFGEVVKSEPDDDEEAPQLAPTPRPDDDADAEADFEGDDAQSRAPSLEPAADAVSDIVISSESEEEDDIVGAAAQTLKKAWHSKEFSVTLTKIRSGEVKLKVWPVK